MLALLDYAVIATYLVAITAFGSWFGRFQRTTRDYFLSGHSVPWWAVLHGRRHRNEHPHLHRHPGHGLCGEHDVPAAPAPRLYRGPPARPRALHSGLSRGDIALYELLQGFGRRVTTLSASPGRAVSLLLADGIRLFATSIVISVVTGVPTAWSTPIVGVIKDRVYTVRGGAAAVILTDVVQMFIAAGARGAATSATFPAAGTKGAGRHGGRQVRVLRRVARPHGGLHDLDGLAGGVALTLATHGTDQFPVQRLLAATSARAAATASC